MLDLMEKDQGECSCVLSLEVQFIKRTTLSKSGFFGPIRYCTLPQPNETQPPLLHLHGEGLMGMKMASTCHINLQAVHTLSRWGQQAG